MISPRLAQAQQPATAGARPSLREDGSSHVDLTFAPGAEVPCTSRAEFLADLGKMLAESPLPAKKPVTEVAIVRSERGYRATVVLAGPGGGTRVFPEQACVAAKNVALLAVALFVDPEYPSRAAQSQAVATGNGPSCAVASAECPVCAPVPEAVLCPPIPLCPALPREPESRAERVPEDPPPPASPGARFAIGSEYRRGLTPKPALAIAVSGEILFSEFGKKKHFRPMLSTTAATAPATGTTYLFGYSSLTSVFCVDRLYGTHASVGGCTGFETGLSRAIVRAPNPVAPGDYPFLGALLRLQATWDFAAAGERSLYLRASADGGALLVRPRYQVTTGEEIYTVPVLGLGASASVGLRL